MQASDGQCHEGDSTGIPAPLRETAALETRRVPASGEESLPEASSVTRDAGSAAVIEALVIAALYALEAHVREVQKRVALLQERQESIAKVAESPAVTAGAQGTPLEPPESLCAAPQPVSHDSRRAANPRT